MKQIWTSIVYASEQPHRPPGGQLHGDGSSTFLTVTKYIIRKWWSLWVSPMIFHLFLLVQHSWSFKFKFTCIGLAHWPFDWWNIPSNFLLKQSDRLGRSEGWKRCNKAWILQSSWICLPCTHRQMTANQKKLAVQVYWKAQLSSVSAFSWQVGDWVGEIWCVFGIEISHSWTLHCAHQSQT